MPHHHDSYNAKVARLALVLHRVITYILVPSTSTQLFRTFTCDQIEYDDSLLVTRQYLHDDLEMRCDSDEPGVFYSKEYAMTRRVALILVGVWPLGIPILYASLLQASSGALKRGQSTALTRATAFLSDDYDVTGLGVWWELFETVCLTPEIRVHDGIIELSSILIAGS